MERQKRAVTVVTREDSKIPGFDHYRLCHNRDDEPRVAGFRALPTTTVIIARTETT